MATVYYGIDRSTLTIKKVYYDGKRLTYSRPDSTSYSHTVEGNRSPRAEIGTVFGLTDVIDTPSQFENSAGFKQEMEALRNKLAKIIEDEIQVSKSDKDETNKAEDTSDDSQELSQEIDQNANHKS